MAEYTGLEVQHWITICVFSLKKCDYYMSQEINKKEPVSRSYHYCLLAKILLHLIPLTKYGRVYQLETQH